MYYGNYRYDTSTQPTGWRDWWDYPLMVMTNESYWPKIDFTPPKWWRWYDVFRTWARPKLLRLLDGYRMAMRRAQERYPARQRVKQKRRAYVQALHAL